MIYFLSSLTKYLGKLKDLGDSIELLPNTTKRFLTKKGLDDG